MKKLKFFICFAAVLFLTTQFAAAQTPGAILGRGPSLGSDPRSELRYNSGRFNTDIDLYHSVNDWADVGVTKWFSFLQMGNIGNYGPLNAPNIPTIPGSTPPLSAPVWEGGLALQLSKVYIATYYNGYFTEGNDSQGSEVINLETGESYKGFNLNSGWSERTTGISHQNYFGIMAGVGKHGFKFTLLENLTTVDTPVYTTAELTDPTDATNPDKAAAGAVGKYLYRNGRIRPRVQWGASEDMTFGKYASRPNASVALDINFYERLYDLTDPDGTVHNYGSYKDNSLTPIFVVDTNGINFIPKGDWGTLVFGVEETFQFTVQGENDSNGDHKQDSKVLNWQNRLQPYAGFSYQPVSFFRLNSRLFVPVNVGWNNTNPNATAGQYWFGIGANGAGASSNDFPFLLAAFQLNLSFIDEITGKSTLWQKFKLNWGIKANLPGFVAMGVVTETHKVATDPDSELTEVRQGKTNYWVRGNPLQSFSAGITFNITDKVLLDGGIDVTSDNWKTWGLTETVTLGRVLLSIKH